MYCKKKSSRRHYQGKWAEVVAFGVGRGCGFWLWWGNDEIRGHILVTLALVWS